MGSKLRAWGKLLMTMKPLHLALAAIGALLGCSQSNDVESCPDGTIPVKGGVVSVETRDAMDTPVPLEDVMDAEDVQLALTEQCSGLLPQSSDCRTYLVVTASAQACADRTAQLYFRFADSQEPDDPAAAITMELSEARYRLPLEGDTSWGSWVGEGPVTIDRNDGGDFEVHFSDLLLSPATGPSADDATGTFLLSGSISGVVEVQ